MELVISFKTYAKISLLLHFIHKTFQFLDKLSQDSFFLYTMQANAKYAIHCIQRRLHSEEMSARVAPMELAFTKARVPTGAGRRL